MEQTPIHKISHSFLVPLYHLGIIKAGWWHMHQDLKRYWWREIGKSNDLKK